MQKNYVKEATLERMGRDEYQINDFFKAHVNEKVTGLYFLMNSSKYVLGRVGLGRRFWVSTGCGAGES